MKRIQGYLFKYGNVLAALAITAATKSVAKACWFWFNQPKVPEGLNKFIKEEK
ncbi:cyclic lactone autoinducer peptide [Ruminococcus flavefaciens]|uniref:Cyclic lactone autoinducer peptide n=1 Tax=Ruminococcus flavefaciens 007c TaxID=1341157 RepID=W7UDG5_RUMFL|nr:cyclic lactone autoinducer peptide [Ruminococcus flavefaciens]EWM53131.1 hypothetical protein RF007C_16090 [Ruminococcus flavefaciens 007c]